MTDKRPISETIQEIASALGAGAGSNELDETAKAILAEVIEIKERMVPIHNRLREIRDLLQP